MIEKKEKRKEKGGSEREEKQRIGEEHGRLLPFVLTSYGL